MATLTAAQLAAMQDCVTNNLLPDTCVLKSVVYTNTKTGRTGVESTVATVACRVAQPQLEERLAAQRIGYELDAVITFADSQAIDPAYRVATGGYTYEIIAPDLDHAWRVAGRVRVKRLVASV